MSLYRVQLKADAYLEVMASSQEEALDKAMDELGNMSREHFARQFEDYVEVQDVELLEDEEDTSYDRDIDIN